MFVRRGEPSWQAALSSISGVYLILDTKTGKTYVGSAYGEGGIWQRWSCYAETGHGRNVELIALLQSKGSYGAGTIFQRGKIWYVSFWATGGKSRSLPVQLSGRTRFG